MLLLTYSGRLRCLRMHEVTCLAARLAFCALFGSLIACCAAPTKLLLPELATAFPFVTTVLVPACASFLKLDVLQAAHALVTSGSRQRKSDP